MLSLRDKNDLYIFTSDSIQDAPEFKPFLDGIFKEMLSAKKMNTDKKLAVAYKLVAEQIQLKPHEIVYIDDSLENVTAAESAGLTALQYHKNDEIKRRLSELVT